MNVVKEERQFWLHPEQKKTYLSSGLTNKQREAELSDTHGVLCVCLVY